MSKLSTFIDVLKKQTMPADIIQVLEDGGMSRSPEWDYFEDEDDESGPAPAYGSDEDKALDARKAEVLELVHSEGGCEGGGDYAEVVYKHVPTGLFFRMTGFYASYNGTDWDGDWKQVVPEQVMVTQYKPVK